MTRLPVLSSREIIKALSKRDFRAAPKRGKGSHIALVGSDAEGHTRLVIVPQRRDVPIGTLLAILDQAGITREEFLKLL